MNDNETYSVTEVEGYCNAIANSIAEEFSSSVEDVYQYCSLAEIKNILEENCVGHDEDDRPIINMDVHNAIFQNVLLRVQNIAISQLASEGYLECAWDEELNDMVFWLKE